MTFNEVNELKKKANAIALKRGGLKDMNDGQRLAAIVVEIGRLIDACLKDRWTNPSHNPIGPEGELLRDEYERQHIGTVEECTASILIACFGYLNGNNLGILNINGFGYTYARIRLEVEEMNSTDFALFLCQHACNPRAYTLTAALSISRIIGALAAWCEEGQMDLQQQAEWKLMYMDGAER